MESNFNQDRYEYAVQRVKRIKGFYTHLLIYVVINLIVVAINVQNLEPGESYFQYRNFITAFFWGIGLVAHAASVFVPSFIFTKKWEEKKIKEFMDKDRANWE